MKRLFTFAGLPALAITVFSFAFDVAGATAERPSASGGAGGALGGASLIHSRETPRHNPTGPREKLAARGVIPMGDWAVNDNETAELNSIFTQASNAATNITPSSDAPMQRKAVELELEGELETFIADYPDSSWIPSIRVFLADCAQMRCGYVEAMDQYREAWAAVKGSPDAGAQQIGRRATSGLARLLALTGRLDEFDSLEAEVRQLTTNRPAGNEWSWALEMRQLPKKHPSEAYKCGLYCLDQLGRLTQLGQFKPKDITETDSSTNGFSAGDLVTIGTKAGLRVRAVLLNDFTNLPVPCIVHLRSEHFVVMRKQRGSFYEVYDTVAGGPKWLTAQEVSQESNRVPHSK